MDTNKIYGLILGCPFGDCAEDCPFNEIRKLSKSERVEYLGNLSSAEKERLVELHDIKFAIRESEKKKKK